MHFRKADSHYVFDPEKHMNLSKQDRVNLEEFKTYDSLEWFVENKTLTEGETFGEMAIITKNPRAATIKCLTNCYCAVMNATVYK